MATGTHKTDFKSVPGVRLGSVHSGIKPDGQLDLVLFEFAPGSITAGIFTQSHFAAAPVLLSRRHLDFQRRESQSKKQPSKSYFLINSGNANAATGQAGLDDAKTCCDALSQLTGATPEAVLPFSTGVIGERLQVEALTGGLPDALQALADDNWLAAAEGIMTTDTRPKIACRQFKVSGTNAQDNKKDSKEKDTTATTITITGIAKGAGMIQPQMTKQVSQQKAPQQKSATLLVYLATDLDARDQAGGQASLLESALQKAADKSFNRITIDGDTSTNDSCMLTATGASGITIDQCQATFESELASLMQELAQGIVRDAEGASKFVAVKVKGGANAQDCLEVAYSIANSPLVKTAFFASDANWGRIVMAIGKALTAIDPGKVDIFIGDVCLMRGGTRAEEYREEQGAEVMAREDITISVNLNQGDAEETVWTCDLSHDYVSINADYRT